jgi:hypothetical protein
MLIPASLLTIVRVEIPLGIISVLNGPGKYISAGRGRGALYVELATAVDHVVDANIRPVSVVST